MSLYDLLLDINLHLKSLKFVPINFLKRSDMEFCAYDNKMPPGFFFCPVSSIHEKIWETWRGFNRNINLQLQTLRKELISNTKWKTELRHAVLSNIMLMLWQMLLNPIAIHNLIHGNILIFFGTFQKMQQDQLNLKNRFSFVDDCPNIFCFRSV